jgi:hypothetical protein
MIFLSDKKLYFESEILSREQENTLTELCNFSDQKWRLLYRASRDGFEAREFHSKCDGNHNTLTLVISSNATIFGGYTAAAWSVNERFAHDAHAYIFSLKNGKNKPFRVKCLDASEAIYCAKDFGPCFGYDDIKISSMASANTESLSGFGYTYEHDDYPFDSDEANSILAGSKNFQVHDIEVFCKDYEPLSQVCRKRL